MTDFFHKLQLSIACRQWSGVPAEAILTPAHTTDELRMDGVATHPTLNSTSQAGIRSYPNSSY